MNPEIRVPLLNEGRSEESLAISTLIVSAACEFQPAWRENLDIDYYPAQYVYTQSGFDEVTGLVTSQFALVEQEFTANWQDMSGAFMNIDGNGLLRKLEAGKDTFISLRYMDLYELHRLKQVLEHPNFSCHRLAKALFILKDDERALIEIDEIGDGEELPFTEFIYVGTAYDPVWLSGGLRQRFPFSRTQGCE